MNTKQSKILNDMMTKLFNKDFKYVDEILSQHSDYYTIFEKTTPEEAFGEGIKLYIKAQKLNQSIIEVKCYPGNFSVYFVDSIENVKGLLKRYLDK